MSTYRTIFRNVLERVNWKHNYYPGTSITPTMYYRKSERKRGKNQ